MHGIIFGELKKYVEVKYGKETWPALLQQSGLSFKTYLAINNYPDEEILAIVKTASIKTAIPIPALLEDFGIFIGPSLLQAYSVFIKPEWKTLDLLEHTEDTIHRIVSMREGAYPPKLTVTRPNEGEALINYTSARRMCALAQGLIKAYAAHYKEEVEISHLSCMDRGDEACNILVRLLSQG